MRLRIATLLYVIAALPAPGCVSQQEKPNKAAAVESFEIGALPADAKRLDTDFDQKITLVGYRVSSRGVAKAGQRVSYTLYWQLNKPLTSKGWGVFTHVLDGNKRRVLNIDKVGPMREANLTPNDWKPGKIYADDQSFIVPNEVGGDSLMVVTGVWRGEERLPVTAGAQLGENRALAITFPTKAAEPEAVATVPSIRVDRLPANTLLKIDGKLDEPAWKSAPSTGAFIDVRNGKAASNSAVQGSARLLWDKDAFYIGFDVEDKTVTGGFPTNATDPHLWTKDTVEIMIDPDGDGDNKDYYEIQVNPQNLVFDSQFDDYNAPRGGENGPFGHQDWSAKLTSAVSINGTLDKAGDEDKGYTVEIKVPWSSFSKAKKSPPELGAEWRINLYAMQDNGGVAWSPILGQGNFHKAARFGRVLFADKDWKAPGTPNPATTIAVATAAVPGAAAAAVAVGGNAVANAVAKPAIPGAVQPVVSTQLRALAPIPSAALQSPVKPPVPQGLPATNPAQPKPAVASTPATPAAVAPAATH